MQNKTTISETDLTEMFDKYNLGRYISFEKFNHGACQTSLRINTSSYTYVLRYFKNRNIEHVKFETKLLKYLKASNFPTPKIFTSRSNKYYEIYKDKPYVITEFVDGGHCTNPNISLDKQALCAIAKIVADLHILTNNYPTEYFSVRTVYDQIYCWTEFCKNHKYLVNSEQGKWFKYELSQIHFPDTLPKGLCHADLNYSNFLFKSGKIVAMLDFDMSFYTYLIYDIASMIYWWAWSPKGGFSLQYAKQIVTEYSKHRNLSGNELKYIVPALKIIILLGIAWSDSADFVSEIKKIKQLKTENWEF